MIIWQVCDLSDPPPDGPTRFFSILEKAVQFVVSVYSLSGGDGSYDEPVMYAIALDLDKENQQRIMRVCNGGFFNLLGPTPHVGELCSRIRESLHQTIATLNLDISEDPRISGEQEL